MTIHRGQSVILRLAFVLVVLSFGGQAVAQGGAGTVPDAWPPEAIYRGATIAPDLMFPVIGEAANELTLQRMALLKPAGDGPFPAIALLHQCAGLNPAVVAWARKAVARYYVVLLVDSLGPRGVKSVCYGPQAGVNLFRGARDALQAAEHLRRQPFVDKDRIALVGFSWGAMAASVQFALCRRAEGRIWLYGGRKSLSGMFSRLAAQ